MTWWSNGYVNWKEEYFKHRMRIERETFTHILETTSPDITKHPTNTKPNPTTDDRQGLPVLMQRVTLLMSIFFIFFAVSFSSGGIFYYLLKL